MEGVTIATLLSDAVTVVTSAVGSVWTMATGNPLLAFGIGVSILGVGIGLFAGLRRSL